MFFHLSQNIYRKVQENHLSTLYQDDDIFRENIRMIGAIAFVPHPDIIMAFGALCVHCGANGNKRVILRYFERNYIADLRAGVRAVPFFPHELWSVHLRVTNGLPRTTNAVDACHLSFKQSVG